MVPLGEETLPLGGGLTLPPVGGAGPVVVVAPPVGEVPMPPVGGTPPVGVAVVPPPPGPVCVVPS